MIVITRTKTEAEGSVKYECPERNDSFGKETKQPNLQKEERSDKSLRVVVVTKKGWVVNQINQTYFLKGLRMKKSVCLMAILGALGATSAFAASQSVDVTFTGSVLDKACTITLHNGGTTLNLGSVTTQIQDGQHGTLVPVVFKFTDCKEVGKPDAAAQLTVNDVELVADLNNQHFDQTLLSNGTISTNNAGIVVQLYKDAEAKNMGLADDHKVNKVGDAQYATVAWAALAKNPAGTVSAGDVTAKAMFKVTYQ